MLCFLRYADWAHSQGLHIPVICDVKFMVNNGKNIYNYLYEVTKVVERQDKEDGKFVSASYCSISR